MRFIYQPRRGIYNWKGPIVKQLETDVAYSAYYFDPATGRRFDAGTVKARSGTGDGLVAPIDGHTEPLLFADNFEVSGTTFKPKQAKEAGKAESADFAMPDLPSPQDWVLVLEGIPQQ